MQYANIPGLDKPVSRIVQGTVMVRSAEMEESFALLDAVFARGCNTFDTAHVYGGGDNERTVGQWVRRRDLRDRVVIVAKGAHHNADRRRVTPFDIASDLHDSLARLGLEYVDVYLLHRDDETQPVEPIIDALNEHLSAGRIRAFGGSNWSHRRIAEANAYADRSGLVGMAVSSPHFSLAEQIVEPWDNCVSITGDRRADAREWYARTQMPVLSWSSLAAGFLSGRLDPDEPEAWPDGPDSPALRCYGGKDNYERLRRARALAEETGHPVPQIATAWVLGSPMNVLPICGPRTEEEFEQNAAALEIELTDAQRDWLDLRRHTP